MKLFLCCVLLALLSVSCGEWGQGRRRRRNWEDRQHHHNQRHLQRQRHQDRHHRRRGPWVPDLDREARRLELEKIILQDGRDEARLLNAKQNSAELTGAPPTRGTVTGSFQFGDYAYGRKQSSEFGDYRGNKESSEFGDYGGNKDSSEFGGNRGNKESSEFGDYFSKEFDRRDKEGDKGSKEDKDYGSEEDDQLSKGKFDILNLFGKRLNLPNWELDLDIPGKIRQLFQGRLEIGEPGAGLDWNVGSMFDELGGEWWTGPNVCKRKEVSVLKDSKKQKAAKRGERSCDLRRHYTYATTECDQTPTAYRCTTSVGLLGLEKTITTILECCHGYQREQDMSGCTKELILEDLLTTVDELGVTELGEALNITDWADLLRDNNYTIFAPSNEALQELNSFQMDFPSQILRVDDRMLKMLANFEGVISAHIMPGFVRTSSLKDEQLIPTEHAEAKIRVNMYEAPKRLVTANCVPVSSPDNMATNGVVHLVDGILEPVTMSLLKTLESMPDLRWFSSILRKSDMSRTLKREGQYTVFAPSDEAFNKLSESARDRLLTGNSCLNDIIKNHILPNVICSSIIEGRARTVNLLDHYLQLSGEDNVTYVEDSEMVHKDIMATNGVLHIIDEILIPDEALDMVEQAKKSGAADAIDLMEEVGLTKTLRTMHNFTVFLPTDRAIQEVSEEEVRKWRSDPDALAKVLRYHIVPEDLSRSELHSGDKLDTMDSHKQISVVKSSRRFFEREQVTTVQCAPIVRTDITSCGGIAHLVDKVLIPPEGDVIDVLYQQSQFSTLVGLLKKAGDLVEELQRADSVTFLAPTNQAFDAIEGRALGRTLESIEQSPDRVKKFLQGHIIRGTVCCSSVLESSWMMPQKVYTLEGSTVKLDRDRDGPLFNTVPVSSCDLTATNGVVHAVDSLLPQVFTKYGNTRRTRGPSGWLSDYWFKRSGRHGRHHHGVN